MESPNRKGGHDFNRRLRRHKEAISKNGSAYQRPDGDKKKIIMELKKRGKKDMDDTQTAVYLRCDLQPITNGASYLPGPPFLSSFSGFIAF